jgi:cytochrome oxidase Cu insertion factor (SCO1/SenC/PrrC family)
VSQLYRLLFAMPAAMALIVAALSAMTQSSPAAFAPGPPVASIAPDFEARDQHGQTRSLYSLLGSNGALLVFFRSADW